MPFGDRLTEERKRLKLGQQAVADVLGVSKKTYIDYEKNRTSPDATCLEVLASLGFNISYLGTGMVFENVAQTPTELALLRNCRAMPTPEVRQAALDAVAALRRASGGKLEGENV